jgi:nitric oxide reductase subunit C
MFHPTAKKFMLAGLVACFVIQSGLVYSDDTDLVLSETAIEGRRLFHVYACQVCHQTWGQGGFLGPDITNAASRVDSARLTLLLTVGSGQMPVFGFSGSQIASIRAYLQELDRPDVGRGQLRLGDPDSGASPQAAFEAAVSSMIPDGPAAAGFEVFRSGICSTCHLPFQISPVGGPDLSTVVERLDEAGLNDVLTFGRPEKGMPPPVPAFDAVRRSEVVAYFEWLNANRVELVAQTSRLRGATSVEWAKLPWWEFR